MKRTSIWVLAAMVAVPGLPLRAQQTAGSSELQLQGTVTIATDGDSRDFGTASGLWGRFLTEHHQVGATASVTIFDQDVFGFGGPFYRYNFATGKVVPYVGAAVETSFGDTGPDDDFLLTLEAGLRYFVNRNTAFTVGTATRYSTESSEFSDGLQILFGFSRLWDRTER